jgi:hypothetical protein
MDNPNAITGEPLLSGFTLDLLPIWEADFDTKDSARSASAKLHG